MNQYDFRTAAHLPPQAALDALQTRFALRVAAALSERTSAVGPDFGERLRVAREKALDHARASRSAAAASAATPVGVSRGGAAILGLAGPGWWLKFASVLPVFALAAGLFVIQNLQEDAQISTAAEVDAALLADDLPPRAYSDAGFAEFLKTPGE